MGKFDITHRRVDNDCADFTQRRKINADYQEIDNNNTQRRSGLDKDATQRRTDTAGFVPQNSYKKGKIDYTGLVFLGDGGSEYKCVKHLHAGGEGKICLCENNGKNYAAKILNEDSDYELLYAFTEISNKFKNNNLLPLYYLGDMRNLEGNMHNDKKYLLMPYYSNGDLAVLNNMQRINDSIISEVETRTADNRELSNVTCDYSQVDEYEFTKLVRQIHQAIKTMHTLALLSDIEGVVHRDIRPQNIMVDDDGNYVLGDYGLVSGFIRSISMKSTSRAGFSDGYSPPEAYVMGNQVFTRKYDYFSFGMTLLHIVSGRPFYLISGYRYAEPYEITGDDYQEIIRLSNVNVPNSLPVRIKNLISGLLLADINYRFGADEVDAWLEGKNPAVIYPDSKVSSGIFVNINKKIYEGDENVANAMIENWDVFADLLESGANLVNWDKEDIVYRKRVDNIISKNRFVDKHIGLTEVILTINPKVGHIYRGKQFLTDDILANEIDSALENKGSETFLFFGEFLKNGVLSMEKKLRINSEADEEALAKIIEIEKLAQNKPASAMLLLSAYLKGQPPNLNYDSSLKQIYPEKIPRMLSDSLERSVDNYLKFNTLTNYNNCVVPGVYIDENNFSFIVQKDGSKIAEKISDIIKPMQIDSQLTAVIKDSNFTQSTVSVEEIDDVLYAWLSYHGNIASVGMRALRLPCSKNEYNFEFFPMYILRYLCLFSEFRIQHEADNTFLKLFNAIKNNLNYLSSLELPGINSYKKFELQTINKLKNNILNNIDKFDNDRTFDNLYAALLSINTSFGVFKEFEDMLFKASEEAINTYVKSLHIKNKELKEDYQSVVSKYANISENKESLIDLIKQLRGLNYRIEQKLNSNIIDYYLSAEAEFVRNYNLQAKYPLKIEVPQTINAEQYVSQLKETIDNKRIELFALNYIDADEKPTKKAIKGSKFSRKYL